MSFEYNFKHAEDEVWFAYSVPYTVSKMHNLVKTICDSHCDNFPNLTEQFIAQNKFCASLSGYDVPMLTITSQVNRLKYLPVGAPVEIDPADWP